MQQIKKAVYRQRVLQLADGTIELVFGNDALVPEDAKVLADHDVMEVATVTDHIEPLPVGTT